MDFMEFPRKKNSVMESMFINVAKRRIDVRLSSKCVSVAGLSSYKDVFLGMFRNFLNILSVEQMWTTASKLLDVFFLNFFFFVWSHFTCRLTKTNTVKNLSIADTCNSWKKVSAIRRYPLYKILDFFEEKIIIDKNLTIFYVNCDSWQLKF